MSAYSSTADDMTRIVFLPPDAFVGWLLRDAITSERAAEMLASLSARGFDQTGDRYPANYRNNDRLVFDDHELAADLFEVLRDRLPRFLDASGLAIPTQEAAADRGDIREGHWELCGLNPRFRACRYVDGQSFCIHRDGPYTPSDDVRSFLTVQLYLDDDPARSGGHTRFYADPRGDTRWVSIVPKVGAAIVFDHRAWHDGEPVIEGIKHVIRTDAMYRRVRARSVSVATESDIVGQHRGYAWHAIALRDGAIASAGRDGTVRFWARGEGDSARSEQVVDLALGSIMCVAEDARGRVWCGTRAGEILVIDRREIANPRHARRIASDLGAITSAVSASGLVAFTTSHGDVVAFDASGSVSDREAPVWSVRAHDGWAWNLAAHGDGFLSCGHDGRVMRIDRGRARALVELGTPVRAIGPVALRTTVRDARETHTAIAIVGDERGWLHWLGRDGRVVRSHRAHAAAVTAIAVRDEKSNEVVSASEDGTVKRWLPDDANVDGTVVLQTRDFVTSVAFDARGDVLAAGYDGAVRRVRSMDRVAPSL